MMPIDQDDEDTLDRTFADSYGGTCRYARLVFRVMIPTHALRAGHRDRIVNTACALAMVMDDLESSTVMQPHMEAIDAVVMWMQSESLGNRAARYPHEMLRRGGYDDVASRLFAVAETLHRKPDRPDVETLINQLEMVVRRVITVFGKSEKNRKRVMEILDGAVARFSQKKRVAIAAELLR